MLPGAWSKTTMCHQGNQESINSPLFLLRGNLSTPWVSLTCSKLSVNAVRHFMFCALLPLLAIMWRELFHFHRCVGFCHVNIPHPSCCWRTFRDVALSPSFCCYRNVSFPEPLCRLTSAGLVISRCCAGLPTLGILSVEFLKFIWERFMVGEREEEEDKVIKRLAWKYFSSIPTWEFLQVTAASGAAFKFDLQLRSKL